MNNTDGETTAEPAINEPTLEDKVRHLEVIQHFAIMMEQFEDVEELLWFVAEHVIPNLDFEDCVIYVADNNKQTIKQVAAWGIKNAGQRQLLNPLEFSFDEGICGDVAKLGRLINVVDTREDSRYKLDVEQGLSECAIPLMYEGSVIGVLDSEATQANYFSPYHERLLITVGALISHRMGKSISSKHVEQTIEKLRSAEQVQKALYEIASLVHKTKNMDDFYSKLHQIIGELMYAGNFYIALYDQRLEIINIPYFVDTVDERPDENISAELLKKSLTFYCLSQQQSLLLSSEDIQRMDDEHGFERYGTIPEAWLGVPFVLNDHTRGIVVVQSYLENIKYSERDKSLFDFVAQHLATTLKFKQAQEQIQHQALHDGLTGLPNRSLFNDRIEHSILRRKRHVAGGFAVLYLDLDHFKEVNDTRGHHAGDLVLQEASRRIKTCIRENDTLARLGGDEFAILLDEVKLPEHAETTAERIITEIEKDFFVDGFECMLSTSIGIRICDEGDDDYEEILKSADLAMYQAKQSGRGRYCIYQEDQGLIESSRAVVRRELKTAISNEEFVLHYQPVIDLKTGQIVSFEVLVRWQHPTRGLLFPDAFIDVAEQTGLIKDIDILVMESAIRELKRWGQIDQRAQEVSVNVNLSARHFVNGEVIEVIHNLLDKYQLSGKQLKIEVTETALIESLEVMTALIEEIRRLGVRILLDDFGTGYSSLSYLHQFPIDMLKIDRSFISALSKDKDDNPIISTILALAESMSMAVVAEGIEEPYQCQILKDMACQYGQGYLFSRPVTLDEAKRLFSLGPVALD